MTFAELSPPYATIVADPPWPYPEGWPGWGMSWDERRALPYSCMALDEIKALPVRDIAKPEGYLFLWTTNRHLPAAFDVLDAWDFTYRQTVVWCKPHNGTGPGGMFVQSTEYVLIGQRIGRRSNARGKRTTGDRAPSTWFLWPRGPHSVKPAGFLDIVEQVSPGPYVELFARQPRLGWDSWGYGYERGEALDFGGVA